MQSDAQGRGTGLVLPMLDGVANLATHYSGKIMQLSVFPGKKKLYIAATQKEEKGQMGKSQYYKLAHLLSFA